jgi:hypothetical protein
MRKISQNSNGGEYILRECEREAIRLKEIGYKEIVDHPKQFVSHEGKVVDTFSGPALKVQVYLDRDGNNIVTLRDEDGWWNNFEIGVLVALHFIPNRRGFKKIRHLDGNRSNNNVSNIIWSELDDDEYILLNTPKADNDNNSGGIRQSHKVYCKETNETYNSIGIAARELCVDQSDLAKSLKKNDGICKAKKSHFCYDELKDNAEFPNEVYFEAFNTETNNTYEYTSIRKMAEALGLNRRTLTKYLNTGIELDGWILRSK